MYYRSFRSINSYAQRGSSFFLVPTVSVEVQVRTLRVRPLARQSLPRRTKQQPNPSHRAFANLALDGHPPPMCLGDAPADRQTQTISARAGGSSCIDPV